MQFAWRGPQQYGGGCALVAPLCRPSNPYYSCSSQSVSVRAPPPLLSFSISLLYIRLFKRIWLYIERDYERASLCRPTRSICKPPRNESVNPVTSFAAILVLRRFDARAIFRQILRVGLVPNANPRSPELLGDRVNANSYARKHHRDILIVFKRKHLCLAHSLVQKCESNGDLCKKSTPRIAVHGRSPRAISLANNENFSR